MFYYHTLKELEDLVNENKNVKYVFGNERG